MAVPYHYTAQSGSYRARHLSEMKQSEGSPITYRLNLGKQITAALSNRGNIFVRLVVRIFLNLRLKPREESLSLTFREVSADLFEFIFKKNCTGYCVACLHRQIQDEKSPLGLARKNIDRSFRKNIVCLTKITGLLQTELSSILYSIFHLHFIFTRRKSDEVLFGLTVSPFLVNVS